jgi:enoyl-CoA hydratase
MVAPPELIRSARIGSTLVLTIDHPPVNVLSRPVLEELAAKVTSAEDDEEARAVVLASAAERAFSAGANIRDMAPMGPKEAFEYGRVGQAVTRAIERLPLPVIAAVHGVAYGGGCEIVLACDFVLASDDAQFGQPEVNLGIMPGWGGTRRLPRRIGAARARRWILTGRPVPAAEAAAAGLVDRVVPRAELLPTALRLGEELAQKPALALAAAKFALLASIDPHIDEGLALELDLWARLFATEGQRDGMEAFLAKRPLGAGPRAEWAHVSVGFPWAHEGTAERPGGREKKAEDSGDD